MQYLAIWNIGNVHFLFPGNVTIVHSFQAAMGQLKGKTNFQAVILLCELSYNHLDEPCDMQRLPGIEMAKELRREEVKLPIVLLSFLSRKHMLDGKVDRDIINATGHRLLRLPIAWKDIERQAHNMEPLNNLEMYDIVHNYSSLQGVISMLLHALNGIDMLTDPDRLKEAVITLIHRTCKSFLLNVEPSLDEFKQSFPNVNRGNAHAVIRFVKDHIRGIIAKYSDDGNMGDNMQVKPVGNWKMLLLDDDIGEDHQLIKILRERGVDLILKHTASEAMDVVETEPLLSLVVADYRLEEIEDGIKVHQVVQGYQFLKELSANRSGYLRLAALSFLPRKFLMESLKYYGLQVEIFSKKDYFENEATIHLLCNHWIEQGNENAEAIVRRPAASKHWSYFEPFYRYHRNSHGYKETEQIINRRAREYCEGIERGEYVASLEGYTAMNLDAKSAKPENKAAFDKFIEKCVCRRVVLWYSQFNPAATLRDINIMLMGENGRDVPNDNACRQQVNVHLALTLEDFPWNMTVEEVNWLGIDMGMNRIMKISAKERAVLQMMSGELLEWKVRYGLGLNDGFEMYGIGFRLLKQRLFEIYIHVVGNQELLRPFYQQIAIWKTMLEKKPGIVNIENFVNYLEYLRKKVKAIKRVYEDESVKDANKEAYLDELEKRLEKKISEGEMSLLKANFYLFWDDMERVEEFPLKKEFERRLMEYHKSEINGLSCLGVEYNPEKEYRAGKRRGEKIDY